MQHNDTSPQRIRRALATTQLTWKERVLLGILTTHDRTKFNPSVENLTQTMRGVVDRRTRDDTRRTLASLQKKKHAKREYRKRDNGADDYTHVWVLGDGVPPSGEVAIPSPDAAMPSGDGDSPLGDGKTPGPKTIQSTEKDISEVQPSTQAVAGCAEEGSLEEQAVHAPSVGRGKAPTTSLRFPEETWAGFFEVPDLNIKVFQKVIDRLVHDKGYPADLVAFGADVFLAEKYEALHRSGTILSKAGFIVRCFEEWFETAAKTSLPGELAGYYDPGTLTRWDDPPAPQLEPELQANTGPDSSWLDPTEQEKQGMTDSYWMSIESQRRDAMSKLFAKQAREIREEFGVEDIRACEPEDIRRQGYEAIRRDWAEWRAAYEPYEGLEQIRGLCDFKEHVESYGYERLDALLEEAPAEPVSRWEQEVIDAGNFSGPPGDPDDQEGLQRWLDEFCEEVAGSSLKGAVETLVKEFGLWRTYYTVWRNHADWCRRKRLGYTSEPYEFNEHSSRDMLERWAAR